MSLATLGERCIMTSLLGKVALITAAASGIGRATAVLMAERGASIAVSDINLENAEKVAEEVREKGGKAVALLCDIGDEEQIKAAVDQTVATFGKLDIQHNNAALLDPAIFEIDVDITTLTAEAWDKHLSVTVRGTALCCKYGVLAMQKNGGGSIINTSSMYGESAFYRQTAYGTSKAAVSMLTQYVATSFGRSHNIRCNAVAPSMVRTPFLESIIPAELIKLNEDSLLVPELAKPIDIARLVAFLASDDAAYINGHVLPADGGTMSHLSTYADARRFYDGL